MEIYNLKSIKFAEFNIINCGIQYHHKRFSTITNTDLRNIYPKLEIPTKFQALDEKINYCLEYTTYNHEKLHFHDYIGTHLGISLFYLNQSIINGFLCNCIPIIKSLGYIKVPLLRWAEADDCPDNIKEYIKDYKVTKHLINWYVNRGNTNYNKVYEISGQNYRKGIDLPYYTSKSNSWGDFPLSGLIFLEGRAFELQGQLIKTNFGKELSEIISRRNSLNPKGWIYEGVIKIAKDFFPDILVDDILLLVDYALMGGLNAKNILCSHPGFRFLVLLKELRKMTDKYSKEYLIEAIYNLSQKNIEFDTDYMMKLVINWIDANIVDTNNKLNHGSNLILYINNIFYKYAKHIFEMRLGGFTLMSNINEYINNSFCQAINQPLSIENVGNEVRLLDGLGDDQEEIFGYRVTPLWYQWYHLEELVKQLITTDMSHCPLKRHSIACDTKTNSCGSIYNYYKNESLECCGWGATIEDLSLNNIKLIKIEG